MRLVERVRDALTGRYTSASQAQQSPSTTVREVDYGVRKAGRALVEAYDADDTGDTTQLAPQFEALRAALQMPRPAGPPKP